MEKKKKIEKHITPLSLYIRRTTDPSPGKGGGLSVGVVIVGELLLVTDVSMGFIGSSAAIVCVTGVDMQDVSGSLFFTHRPLAHGDPSVGCHPSSVFTHVQVTILKDMGISRESIVASLWTGVAA